MPAAPAPPTGPSSPSSPQSQVDYATPPPPARRPVTDVPLTLVLLFCAAAITYVLLFVAPYCQSVFADRGVGMSAATRWTLTTARTITPVGWAVLWVPVVVLPVVWSALRPWPPRRRSQLGAYSLLAVVLMGVIVAFLVVALIMPIIQITHGVAGG